MYILLKSFFPNFIKLREESVQESPSEESNKLSEEDFIDIGILLKNEADIVSKNEDAQVDIVQSEDAQVGSVQNEDDINILLKNEDDTCNKAQVNILLARYSRMQLIDICRSYGLPRAGGKVQLAERIAIYKNKD